MKARVCEICERTIIEPTKKEMLYEIYISEAEDFECSTAAEKKLLFSLDDVCLACTAKVKAAIEIIVKGAKKK